MEKTKSQADAADTTSFANLLALGQLQNVATGGHATDPVNLGHKFGLPDLPLPSDGNLKYRYDPVVSQVTTLLMKHGKLSVAQRVGPSVSLFSFCGHLLRRTKDFLFLCKTLIFICVEHVIHPKSAPNRPSPNDQPNSPSPPRRTSSYPPPAESRWLPHRRN